MAARERWLTVDAANGRTLRAVIDDASGGRPLVFHWGTPGSAVWFAELSEVATAAGLRLIMYSRPGYDESTPDPGRNVAGAWADVEAILDALKLSNYVTLGWSGGGPHALACAALSSGRCLAAATLGSIAPYQGADVDWFASMGVGNVKEFSAAIEGEPMLRPLLMRFAEKVKTLQGRDMAASFGSLASEVDKQALTGEFAHVLASSFRRAVSTGVEGWLEDDLAFVRDWGFALDSITTPVSVWQGVQDQMVPYAHGQWLAKHIPTARAHLDPEHGHLSLIGSLARIVDDLTTLAEPVAAN